MIEFLQVLAHVFKDVLHCYVHFLHDSLVDVSYYLLDHFELLEKFSACFEDVLGENVFLAIYPEVGESFLSGVKDFGEVAKRAFFVENFISF